MNIESIIFYLLFLDALGANFLVFFGAKWYMHHLRIFSRLFPPAKGWTLYYLFLVVLMGIFLFRSGKLF